LLSSTPHGLGGSLLLTSGVEKRKLSSSGEPNLSGREVANSGVENTKDSSGLGRGVVGSLVSLSVASSSSGVPPSACWSCNHLAPSLHWAVVHEWRWHAGVI
jgi:hypothetical protein